MQDDQVFRVGLVVPSSNVTMEREIPAVVRGRERVAPERFSFHSSRMRMRHVTQAELRQMDAQADRCVGELADAGCDILVYACLVAVMAQGPGYHREVEARLTDLSRTENDAGPVVSSAGALVDGIKTLGAERVALLAPYVQSLTDLVVDYLGAEDIQVTDHLSLEVADNDAVGCIPPEALRTALRELDLKSADALVLSACVQMPSLNIVSDIEQELGLPVLTAATASAYQVLRGLDLEPAAPGAGRLLARNGGGNHG